MHLANEVLDHLFRNFKVGNHAVAHRADGFDVARRTTKHHLGLIANSENLLLAALIDNGDHGRFVEHNAPRLHIDQRIRCPQVDGHIGR